MTGWLAALALIACSAAPTQQPSLPPLSKFIQCLPAQTALIAAHRGTDRQSRHPENSISGLKALLSKGYMMSEIDVAQLKDGTIILFHDGIWDEKSTGRGIVAQSTLTDLDSILLRDRQGRLSADRPATLDNYLEIAQQKIYLEVDFKSSADYRDVISKIRQYDMSHHVILIAYNQSQALALHRLAPDMAISTPIKNTQDLSTYINQGLNLNQLYAWQNNSPRKIDGKNLRIISKLGMEFSATKAFHADILVTDYPFSHRTVSGFKRSDITPFDNCLAEQRP